MTPCPHERTKPAADDGSEILKKRRHRNSVLNIPLLCERCGENFNLCLCPRYQGTDDDLPISLWEDPEL